MPKCLTLLQRWRPAVGIIGGKVIWATGFVMLVGQFFRGANGVESLVLKQGQKPYPDR